MKKKNEEKNHSAGLIHQTIPDVAETEPRLSMLQKIAIEAHHEMDGANACVGAECPKVKQLIQFAYDAWDLIADEAVSHLNQPHTCHGNEHMPPGPCLACEREQLDGLAGAPIRGDMTSPREAPALPISVPALTHELDWVLHAASLRGLTLVEYVRRAINLSLRKEGVDAVLLKQSDE